MPETPGKCPRCGEPWTDHAGVEEPICRGDQPTTTAARFEIRATHHYAYRSGEWADLVTVTRHANARQVYLVRFSDGASDFWPVEDAMAGYEFREKATASA